MGTVGKTGRKLLVGIGLLVLSADAARACTGSASYDSGDFNLTGVVEIGDFSLLAANFNTSATAVRPTAVPEASTAILAGLFGTAACRRRRQ